MSCTCPSSNCKKGASLLGVINEEGRAEILAKPLSVTNEFIEIASKKGNPEQRFRFANKCIESGCGQWSNGRCGVIDTVMAQLESIAPVNPLPTCGIRKSCRWFQQGGAEACNACTYVITELANIQEKTA